MTKLIAILNVVAWSGFWVFGYLALAGDPGQVNVVVAAVLAAVGAGIGIWAYFFLVRHAEATGYAKAPPRARAKGAGPVNAEEPS